MVLDRKDIVLCIVLCIGLYCCPFLVVSVLLFFYLFD